MSGHSASLDGATLRIGVVDIRLPGPSHGEESTAAWRRARGRVWIVGCHATLVTDAGESLGTIVSRIGATIARSRRAHARVNIDLLAHGQLRRYGADASGRAFSLQLGDGLAISNAGNFRPLSGQINKLRLFACGEHHPLLRDATPGDMDRAHLAWALADALQCRVVSSASSVVYSINASPSPDPSIRADGFEEGAAAVYHYLPNRQREMQPLYLERGLASLAGRD
jgi:hypothetical protein